MLSTNNQSNVTQWIAQRTKKIFGFRITPTTQQDIIDATVLSVKQREQLIIVHQNLHGLYLANTNEAYRQLHALPQSLVHIDGYPIVYLAWLHGLFYTRLKHRTAIHDWLPPYTQAAGENGYRIYCIGSSDDVNQRAVRALSDLAPNAVIKGHSGYFDATIGSPDNQALLDDITDFDPTIVIVGMGMGRQEQWILDNEGALGNRCIIAVGACLEYMAGEMSMCPRWFGPFGLEMVWRLASHPRRYAHRYLIEPWLLLGLLIKNGRLFYRDRKLND